MIVIIDIKLSLIEQRFDDIQLSKFCSLKATEASQEVRSLLRIDAIKRDTTVVYRLPVVHNWSSFPFSLRRFKDDLLTSSSVNPHNTQYVIWSEDYRLKIDLLTNKGVGSTLRTLKLSDIQQSEMINFLSKNDVLFEHSGSAIFALPSAQYSDYFLRVGNLQSSHSFFSAIFFWFIPYLREIRHIFCDTWSISTTAAVLAESLMTYQHPKSQEKSERISWSFSPSYLPSSRIKEELIQDALMIAEIKEGKVLFLSSFYSSGRLEQEIVELTLSLDRRESARLVAIYAVGKRRFKFTNKILCDIQPMINERGLLGKKVVRRFDSSVLTVSKVSFFPDYRVVEKKPLLIRDIRKDDSFLNRYLGKGIFSVHRDGRHSVHFVDGSRRHHAFHVDLKALFANETFRSELSRKIISLPKFDCILLDHTEGANALYSALQICNRSSTENAEVFITDDWRKLRTNESALNKINHAGSQTLIILPTIITGQTLGDIKRHLRETSAHSLDRIHFLVGLLRPGDAETMRNYTQLANKYIGARSISIIEAVNIPNWGKQDCPWCREQDRLERVLADSPLSDNDRLRLLSRIQLLQDKTGIGMIGAEVFFNYIGDDRLPFYAKSLFVDVAGGSEKELNDLSELSGIESSRRLQEVAKGTSVSEADLCFVAAVAFQNWRLRVTGKSVTKSAIDAATVANDDKFNEARLRAAIWRSLRPEELSLAVRVSPDFQNMCNRIFGSGDEENHQCLSLEALLAFGPEIILHFGGNVGTWNWNSLKYLAHK